MEDILPPDQQTAINSQFRGAIMYQTFCQNCNSIQYFFRLRDPCVPAYGVCQRCHHTASVGEEIKNGHC